MKIQTFHFALAVAVAPWCAADTVTVEFLHPAAAFDSRISSGNAARQGGVVTTTPNWAPHAAAWTGTASSFVDLHPAGAMYTASRVFSIAGNQLGGNVDILGSQPHAAIWSGTSSSFVDLNPAGYGGSGIGCTTGTQQGGYALASGPGSQTHAGIWSGTAASFVDLAPAGSTSSGIDSIGGGQQAGFAAFNNTANHAAVWSGTAASFIDLHPAGYDDSHVTSTTGIQQAGYAIVNYHAHAGIWSGTASSFLDLNPAGAVGAWAMATDGTHQVGYALFSPSGGAHAGVWSGTAASFVDLHDFLPAAIRDYQPVDEQDGVCHSYATAVWQSGASTVVAGTAYNGHEGREEAVLWTITPDSQTPPPGAETEPAPEGTPTGPISAPTPIDGGGSTVSQPAGTDTPPPAQAPTVAIDEVSVVKSALFIKGTARGEVTGVSYRLARRLPVGTTASGVIRHDRAGVRSRPVAVGETPWTLKMKIPKGRKYVLITAHGPGGDSHPVAVTLPASK